MAYLAAAFENEEPSIGTSIFLISGDDSTPILSYGAPRQLTPLAVSCIMDARDLMSIIKIADCSALQRIPILLILEFSRKSMSMQNDGGEKERVQESTKDWATYYWQMMVDFALLTMVSSLMFGSAMLNAFDQGWKKSEKAEPAAQTSAA